MYNSNGDNSIYTDCERQKSQVNITPAGYTCNFKLSMADARCFSGPTDMTQR